MSDELGDRMKAYELREAKRSFLPLLPICVRIDGKRFSRWTRGLARPYDSRLSEVMMDTTAWLVEETGACIGYTQSDEISLVLYSDDHRSQVFLDGRIQKLTSILASMATARFNQLATKQIPERADLPATFDCRAWTVPKKVEAANTLLWRELDAAKNSLSMAARHHYSHGSLLNKGASELHELLHEVGVDWNDYPSFFKRGTFIQRREVVRAFTADELEALPEKHAARTNPDLEVRRSVTQRLDMPPFGRVTNRVEVVFDAEDPKQDARPET